MHIPPQGGMWPGMLSFGDLCFHGATDLQNAVLENLEAAKMGCSRLFWQVMLEKVFLEAEFCAGSCSFWEASA